jgi:heme/copper-type cytochrome/quinol oxidase subunit 3
VAQRTQAVEHLETATGLDNRKLAMWLFLASEALFFGSLIATYLLYRGQSQEGPFPKDVFNIPFTSVSSFILLMSSTTMALAVGAAHRGRQHQMCTWLLCTALLGISFLAGQAFEFTEFVHKGLTLSTNLFGSSFYVLTGFHGAHVSVGVLILLSLWVMAARGRIGQHNALNVELAGLYWHFVDIVWILIFTLVYLLDPLAEVP